MISGLSTRKGDLPGKIFTLCIQNHPIAPGNRRIGRGSCHSDLEKHTFRANIARERAYCVHSSKRGRIRRDSCQLGPRAAAVQGGDARFYGAARRVTALERATQRVAASAERARRARQWWVLRCRGAAGGHGGAGARRWRVLRAGTLTGAALRRGGATLVTALELTAQQVRWKRVTVGREESGLARRNTPARVAAIRPNWRALPQRALRALR